MIISRRIFSAVVALAMAAGTTAMPAVAQEATQALSRESVIETIKERGVIKIGLSVFVPWSMRDKNGDLIGFVVVADAVVDTASARAVLDDVAAALTSCS